MKSYSHIVYFFICSFHLALGQSSIIMPSNGVLETDFYNNQIVSSEDGFFTLYGTGESKSGLILSKFDACYNQLWTKLYKSSFDLSIRDAMIHDNKLIILFVTHFNSSTTRTPILLRLDLEGEVEFSYRYNKGQFDNFTNLSQYNNQYHIMGASTGGQDGGGHFIIDEFGDVVHSNVLSNNVNSSGTDFGCTVSKNGMVIRRHNNTLILCDSDQNIIWAKRFKDFGQYSLVETKPLVLDDGFVHIMQNGDEVVLFKMDFSGTIIWSILGSGRHYNAQPVINNNLISFFWRSPNTEGEYIPNYTEVEQIDGTIALNKQVENVDGRVVSWPGISTNSNGDIFISGSIEEDSIEKIVFINPHLSECTLVSEIPKFDPVDLEVDDVTNNYEVKPVSVSQNVVDFTISDLASYFYEECNSQLATEIDTSLDCNNSYVFDGNLYGSAFLWSDGRTDSLRTFDEAQEISVTVQSCNLEKEINLTINESTCDCMIHVPNIIMKSAINIENRNLIILSNCDFNYYSFTIFDRWGNLVFLSRDLQEAWNPTNQSQGVYTWMLKWSTESSPDIQVDSGTITYLK